MVPIIWVEGLLAAGKTKFCHEIAARLEFECIEEPVDSNFYLEAFYEEPPRHAFGMQIFLLHYRYAMKQRASYTAAMADVRGLILDRSIAGDRVFAKLHWQAGNISDLNWRCYQFAYEVMARTIQPPTLLIYLDVQPETAFRRMQQRARPAERGVTLEYLESLRDGYEELLHELRRGLVPWSHAVETTKIVWDRETLTENEWQAVAATVAREAKIR